MSEKTFKEINVPFVAGGAPKAVIRAECRGRGQNVVVLSNMETNDPGEWEPLLTALDLDAYRVLTYSYPDDGVNQEAALNAVLDFIENDDREETDAVILIGGGLGGVTSLRVAAKRGDGHIAAVVAISVPEERCGERLYSVADLRMITAPKLFINTEFNDFVEGTRNVFATVEDPRQLTIYPGDAHGTGIFQEHAESLVLQLSDYIAWAVNR